jgi:hypothetical protein
MLGGAESIRSQGTNMQNKWKARSSHFRLPMTATFSTHTREDGKAVAHALDFDIVAVSDTKDQAVEKLRLAVKTYIEFGLNNNWSGDIIFPAPDEYWDRIPEDTPASFQPPIEIEDNRLFIVSAMVAHEHQRTARTA